MKICYRQNAPLLALMAALWIGSGGAFAPFSFTPRTVVSRSTSLSLTEATAENEEKTKGEYREAVRAPLKFLGPYPCLGLKFPELATSSQKTRNVSGISLDFVLDTAANTNTINAQVAKELDLSVVGKALPGVGAAGAISGGETFMLGDAELEGLPEEQQFTFMQGLTASALPVASPTAAGLLSGSFFYCFEGGVEFQWGSEGTISSVTFYGAGESDSVVKDMTRVPIKEQPVTRLPSVQITVNGVTFPALLDTGSPITVLNSQAAEQAGIETVDFPTQNNDKKGGNPFSKIANRFKEAQAAAQAAARGDVLTIAGTTGEPVNLLKSQSKAQISATGGEEDVSFGESNIYVGNLPGLAALGALGDDSPPAAVLGMDVLRLRPRMLLKAQNQEVYF